MRQSTRRYVMFVGATFAVAGGLFAAACGTDNGGSSSGTLPTAEGGGGDRANPPPPPPSGGDAGGDSATNPDCSTAPKLRTNTNDFYCAFVPKADGGAGDGGDAGNPSFCRNTEICCNPSTKTGSNFDPSFCATDGTKGSNDTQLKAEAVCAAAAGAHGFTWGATDGGSAWECADKNNCPAGQVCCLTGNPGATGSNAVNIGKSTDKTIPAACNALQAFKETGTACKTSCAAGTEIQLCSQSDNNCGAGTTCTAFNGFFRDLGVCR